MGSTCSKRPEKDAETQQNDVSIAVDATDQEKKKGPGVRARRLSVMTPPPDDADEISPSPIESPPCPQEMLTKKKTTRDRRLSVVAPPEDDADSHKDFIQPDSPVNRPVVVRDMSRSSSSRSRSSMEAPFVLDVECLSRTGREPGFKKTNQDNCFAFEKFVRRGHSLYAAFDGHGPNGHIVSSFVKHQLPLMLTRKLRRSTQRELVNEDMEEALREVFLNVHESVCQPPIDAEFSGTTATVALAIGTKLFVGWVGDSRCVLGLRKDDVFVAKDVTRDHKPDHPDERKRIVSSGGRVKRLTDDSGNEIGPSRVWLKYAWVPGLAMSRALGDICAHQVGVSSEPDISITELTPDVAFLVVASDGVWEFVTSQEAVDIISTAPDAAIACRKLVDESYHRWLIEENGVVDDITAVVVKFDHSPTEPVDDDAIP